MDDYLECHYYAEVLMVQNGGIPNLPRHTQMEKFNRNSYIFNFLLYPAGACEHWSGNCTSGINDPFTPLNRPVVKAWSWELKLLFPIVPFTYSLVPHERWTSMFQFSRCHNDANGTCSLRYAMKLKNNEMHCVQALVQMQSIILRWFVFITLYLYRYSFIITLITFSVILRRYEDANSLLTCYDSIYCFILKSILPLLGSVPHSGNRHLKLTKLEHSNWYPERAYKTWQLLLKYLLLQLTLLWLLLPICGPQGQMTLIRVCLSQKDESNFCKEKIEVLAQKISTPLLLTVGWWDLGEAKLGTATQQQ